MSSYNTSAFTQTTSSGQYQVALSSLAFLFFIIGFITCLNDILIPHLKNVFDLTYAQASLIQFCFFGAYFVASVPAGWLVKVIGYKSSIVVGLLLSSAGCVLFYPASALQTYPLFLFALFVLATGFTLLQVAMNPYVTILGPESKAASRLTLTQAFNSLGTAIAPFFGSLLILSGTTALVGSPEYKIQEAESVQIPYLVLSALLILVAILFTRLRLPQMSVSSDAKVSLNTKEPILKERHLLFGIIAIFAYVGGEVSLGSYLVSFMQQPEIAGLQEHDAGKLLSYYWGGAMVGRFVGAIVMKKVAASVVLSFNAIAAFVLVSVGIFNYGDVAMWALLSVGLFNSIMFPTIFSLAVRGLGSNTSRASGFLCAAIVGGAIVPVIQGVLADYIDLHWSFLVPLCCYLYIIYYGIDGHKRGKNFSDR
jgi:FHS family L-fucose permease-like MFS transporter